MKNLLLTIIFTCTVMLSAGCNNTRTANLAAHDKQNSILVFEQDVDAPEPAVSLVLNQRLKLMTVNLSIYSENIIADITWDGDTLYYHPVTTLYMGADSTLHIDQPANIWHQFFSTDRVFHINESIDTITDITAPDSITEYPQQNIGAGFRYIRI